MNNKLHSFKKLLDGQNLHYDLFDRLVKVETFKKNTETGEWEKEVWVFEYDALDRRIAKYRELSDGLKAEEREFVWDGSHLLQEVYANGRYTYIYTDVDSYEPLAQIHNYTNEEFETKQETNYFHCDQIGMPCEMTDKDGRLLWFGDYFGWGKLKSETNVTKTAHQPFRLQNQYYDEETGLHYNFFRYYEPDAGRFVNQDPIGLWGGDNFYAFAVNVQDWIDPLGLIRVKPTLPTGNLKQGWIHIDARHISGNHPKGAGDLFPDGTSRKQIEKAINKVVMKGRCVTEDPNKTVQTFEKKIVVNKKKDLVRVVVDTKNNTVITAFPVRGGH